MPDLRGRTLLATFFHAPACGAIEVLERALVRIDAAGVIAACLRPNDPGYGEEHARAGRSGTLVRLADSSVVLPGFVDLHVHAPQYPQLGTALDRPRIARRATGRRATARRAPAGATPRRSMPGDCSRRARCSRTACCSRRATWR